ncbi:hypothetical protein ACFWYW_05335 [Nonomuraea sp. NPDC059023]|uniref:hypothetical protein n=1 Tax=unclassified Nonomuraea TaxID=2593643 RepID=UPI0036CEEEA4
MTILAVLVLAFSGLVGADTWQAIACAVKPSGPPVIVADREEISRFWAKEKPDGPVATSRLIVKQFPGEPDPPPLIGLERGGPPGCPEK